MNKYFIHDARHIGELNISQVDLIVTSPPYFDMKDYGSKNQIGYGQKYEDYLSDLGQVFKQCYSITKDSGSLWMVVDNLRKEGQTYLVPFDVIRRVEKSGWILQDIIIWKKDKTVPYAHKGQMRNIFEYVLFFTKSKDFKFYRERITSITDLKEWWVKYPERYSPNGKSETNIWEHPIPLQGSWGRTYIKHFCPLPNELIERIIDLCSDIGDVVFDPFAGSGAVLSAAHRLNRKYVGTDLSKKYQSMFLKYIKTVKPLESKDQYSRNSFEHFSNIIHKLRLLKFPKKVYSEGVKNYPKKYFNVLAILAIENKDKKFDAKHKFLSGKYIYIVDDNSDLTTDTLEQIAKVRPTSKFGIQSEFIVVPSSKALKTISKYAKLINLWRYDNGITYKPGKNVKKLDNDLLGTLKVSRFPPIFSPIEITEAELTL